MRRLHLIAVGVMLLSMTPAIAHQQRKQDGNDVSQNFDIDSVLFKHTGQRVIVRISTYDTWPATSVRRGREVGIRLWTRGERYNGHHVRAYHQNGRWKGEIIHFCEGQTCVERVGNARVKKLDARTLRVSFRRSKVQGYRGWIRWYVTNPNSRDSVPNNGSFWHGF